MTRYKDKALRLQKELKEALDDERYKNLSFVAAGNLSRGAQSYLNRHTEKICRLRHEYDLCLRIQRIIDGEVFTLEDINACRLEIMRQYPEYEQPVTARSGIIFAVEAIRKSFGRKYYLPLYRHPIRIDFGTANGRIYIIHSSNFIEYEAREKQSPET
ncbi:hypothetical protein [Alistipes putredinis]|uniref:hypothetical protein n=1 Tax=Alistipes putredinis TaxID=28117 RepID=UPI003AB2B2F7